MNSNKFYYFLLLLFSCINLHYWAFGGKILYSFPFKIEQNRIFIKGKINNKECLFLYDTGSGSFSIDNIFFRHLNIQKGSTINIILEGQYTQKLRKYDIQNIHKYTPNAKYAAVIDVDFFSDYMVKIDYQNRKIELYNKQQKNSMGIQVVANLTINRKKLFLYGFFYAKAKLNICDTIIEGDFLIDTGSGRYITILNYEGRLNQLKSKLKNIDNYFEMESQQIHMQGYSKSLFSANNTLYFENQVYNNTIVDITNTNIKYNSKHSFVGIIGGGFLKQFNLYNNYSLNSLIIEKKINSNNFDNLFSDGLKIVRQGRKLIIAGILYSSETNITVQIGDEILEINGVKAKKVDLNELRQKKQNEGAKINYLIKRGNKQFLFTQTVKDFFKIISH